MDSGHPAFVHRILPFCRHPGWLGQDVVAGLLAHAADNQDRFRPSTIRYGEDKGVDLARRRSLRLGLCDLGHFGELLRQRALAALPAACAELKTPIFTPQKVEIELVAHGEGEFFVRHTDTFGGSSSPKPLRRVTMVYYLHKLPKVFTGGQLRFYALDGDDFIDIEPECDEMVTFPSWGPHSVEPVSVPGGAFADSRFAVGIWIRG